MYSNQLWSAMRFSSSLSMSYNCVELTKAVRPGSTSMLSPEPSAQSTCCFGADSPAAPPGILTFRKELYMGGSIL